MKAQRLTRIGGALSLGLAASLIVRAAGAPTDLKWSLYLAQNLQSPAINSQGTIYVTSSQGKDGTIHGIRDSGTKGVEIGPPWVIKGSNPTSLPAPVIGADDTVYFGPDTGSAQPGVFAVNPLLQLKWYASTANRGGVGGGLALGSCDVIYKVGHEFLAIQSLAVSPWWRFVDWPNTHPASNGECAPIIGPDGRVYFSPALKQFVQVDPQSGATVYPPWSLDYELHSTPAFGDDGLIYVCTRKQIVALNPTNHTSKVVFDPANKSDFDFRGTSPILGPDGTLYLGNGNKKFYAIDSRTGTVRATLDTMGTINAPAAIAADGTVYFGTAGGVFYAVRLEGASFAVKGQNSGWGKINSAPAIASDGTVFVTDDSGFLLAFRGTSGPADSAWPMFQQNARRTGAARKPPVAPAIVEEPVDQAAWEGTSVTFAVQTSGTGPLAYQWQRNGQVLAGATQPSLTLSKVTAADAGDYQLVVTNGAGTARSRVAKLTVTLRPSAYVRVSTAPTPEGLEVRLRVEPPAGVASYGIELEVPANCTGTAISDGGEYDTTNQRIKWAFLDAQTRTLSVILVGPVTDTAVFKGLVSFDGSSDRFPGRPQFLGPVQISGQTVTLHAYGLTGRRYVLEASDDLAAWQAISDSFEGTDGVMELADPAAAGHPYRFYRLQEVATADEPGAFGN